MSIDSRIEDARSWVAEHLEGRQLIGEIELDDQKRFKFIYLIQDLVQLGRKPTQEAPEVVSLLLVDIARRQSNGNQLWESVISILIKRTNCSEAEKNRWRMELGETFLATVRQYHMPEFRQLVEEGARKYVGPILAHALMPREHIDTFMEKVIWPAIERPAEVGRDARDIQDWLATHEKRVTTEAVRRFVLYGGPVARDLIDRTLAYCESSPRGQADSGSGLPVWLRRGIDQWLKQRQTHVPRPHSSQRRARPAVRFDWYRCEVVVDLPYVDNPATWRVMVAPGGEQYEVDACPPRFARAREKEALGVSRPANALRVELVHEGSQPDRWEIPLLSEDRPVLFFAERDGRLLPAGEVLDGDSWWLLAPGDSKLETDGQLTVCDTPGPPLGWNGYLMQLIRCEGATELRVAPVGWQAASDGPRYRVAGHAQSAFFTQNPLPAWLEPLNTDSLATEDALPELCIPDRPGSSPERYLSFWEVRAERVGETAETYVLPAARLPRVLQDGTWRLQLHDLIPGCGVGTWNVAANGPIGLGVRQRIGILPAGVRGFDVPLAPRVRRPAADGPDSGDIRLVMVQIPGEVQVAAPGDLGQAAGHDVWILKDLDGDGRIPLAVTDSRTGRTTSAVVVLPTVEWRWLSAKPRGWQESAVIPLDEVLAGDWELQVHASAPVRTGLRLVTADGHAVQEPGPTPGQRSANFSLRNFSSTVQGRTDRLLYLELIALNEHGQDAARVGAIERLFEVREVTTHFDDGRLFCSWQQDVDVDGMTAFLEPHWRPWEEPVDGEIEGGNGRYHARWWLNARGPMRLTLRVQDHWVGETTVVDQVVQVGGEMEQREYVLQLREACRNRRGVGGVHALFERFFARDAPPAELGKLARSADAAATREIFRTLVGLVERGATVPVEQLNWSHLGASLAALPAGGALSSEVTRGMTALLEAIAQSEPSPRLASLLAALGLPAWRALGRTELPDGLRRKLWLVWPPLAAILDSKHLQEPQVIERWRLNIGEPLSSWEDAAQRGGNWLKVLQQLRSSGGAQGQVAAPGPLLTEDGWQRAVWADLQGLNADGQVLERGPEPDDVKKFAADVQRTWQRDFAAQLRRPVDSARGPDYLPWMSLVLACWQRRYARGRVTASQDDLASALRLAARVARAMPNVYERDLCLAEALMELN